jgi:hypothetical protein
MTMIEVPGWPAVFRGSWAVRAGLVSPAQVKGSRYRRIFPDVYVPAASDLDLRLRAHAAYLHMQARGVISGYAAAELHRAGCAPSTDVLPDITVPGGGFRAPDGEGHRPHDDAHRQGLAHAPLHQERRLPPTRVRRRDCRPRPPQPEMNLRAISGPLESP